MEVAEIEDLNQDDFVFDVVDAVIGAYQIQFYCSLSQILLPGVLEYLTPNWSRVVFCYSSTHLILFPVSNAAVENHEVR